MGCENLKQPAEGSGSRDPIARIHRETGAASRAVSQGGVEGVALFPGGGRPVKEPP